MAFKRIDIDNVANVQNMITEFGRISAELTKVSGSFDDARKNVEKLTEFLEKSAKASSSMAENIEKLTAASQKLEASQRDKVKLETQLEELQKKIIQTQKAQIEINEKEADSNRKKAIQDEKEAKAKADRLRSELALETQKRKEEERQSKEAIRQKEKEARAAEKAAREKEKERKELEKQTGTINRLNKLIAEQTRQRNMLNLETKEGREKFERLTRELNNNIRQQQRYNEQIGRHQGSVGNYPFKKLSDGFANIAGKAGIYGAALVGVISAFKSALSISIEFDKALSKLSAVTQKSKEELEPLVGVIKQLGATTAFTAKEATEGAIALAQAGFSMTEIMDGLESTLQLATAGELELGEAADIASNVLSGFGLKASETQRVVDVMAASASSANVTIASMGESFKEIASTANVMGISVEEVGAAIDALGNVGIKGTNATNTLQSSLLRLADPPKMAARAMKNLNIELFDARGEYIGITGTIKELEKNFEGLTTKQKAAAVSAIFGKNASNQWLSLLEGTKDVIVKDLNPATKEMLGLTDDMGTVTLKGSEVLEMYNAQLLKVEGTGKRMSEEMLNNLDGDITKASSAWEGFMLSLDSGNGVFSRIARSATQAFTEIVSGLTELNKTSKDYASEGTKAVSESIKEIINDTENAIPLQTRLANELKFANEDLANSQKALEEQKSIFNIFSPAELAKTQVYEQAVGVATKRIELLQQAIADPNALNQLETTVVETTETIITKTAEEIEKEKKARQKAYEARIKKEQEVADMTLAIRKKLGLVTKEELYQLEIEDLRSHLDKKIITEDEYYEQVIKAREAFFGKIQTLQEKEAPAPILRARETGGGQPEPITDLTATEKIAGATGLDVGEVEEVGAFAVAGFDIATQAMTDYYAQKQELVQQDIANRQENIDSLNNEIDAELNRIETLREADKAYNKDTLNDLKEKLAKEEQAKADSQKESEKIAKRQFYIDQAVQASAMITSVAQIFAGFTKIPILGWILGAAAVGSFLVSFAQTKKNLTAKKAKKGAFVDRLGGESHENGGSYIEPANIEAEKDEGMAIYPVQMMNKEGKAVRELNTGLLKGKFTATELLRSKYSNTNLLHSNVVFHQESEKVLPELEKQTRLLSKMNTKNNINYLP